VIGFLIRRLIQAVIVIIFVMLIMFLLVHVIPGGEARAVLGPRATQVQIYQFQLQNGLTLPIWDQIIHYLWNLSRFQLGSSPKLNQSVISLIGSHLPKTLILVGLATIVAVIVAVPLGIYQVIRRYKPEDYVLTGLIFVLYAMPAFLLGTLLILWFAIYLPWFSVEATAGPVGALRACGSPSARAPRPHRLGDHHRLVQPLHALFDDGRHGRGLHPHGACERAPRANGCCSGTPSATRSSRSSRCSG
jgi:ABC-type dipeptide/oligopeptide/nickel transport system permease component